MSLSRNRSSPFIYEYSSESGLNFSGQVKNKNPNKFDYVRLLLIQW